MTYKKIAIISDLHVDAWPNREHVVSTIQRKCEQTGADLIICAGDVADGFKIQPSFDHISPPVLFVPGNHDHYGHYLPDEPHVFIDEQIFASTLWSNFEHEQPFAFSIFRRIRDAYEIKDVTADRLIDHFNQTIDRMRHANKEIVVTHFPPCQQSISPAYAGNPTNPYFVNDLEGRIQSGELSPKLWICGHVHWKHSYRIKDTLVVCNPLGYPRELYRRVEDYNPVVVVRQNDGTWEIEQL